MTRLISEIAREIKADLPTLGKSQAARFPALWPYLEAMLEIDDINGMYGCDSAKSVVNYFLANAASWRGETARRIKAELKALVA